MKKQSKVVLTTALIALCFQAQAIKKWSDKPIQLDNSGAKNSDTTASFGGPGLMIDDGTTENAIGDAGQFMWINRFTPAPGDFPFQLENVSVVFGTTEVNVGDNIEIFIYEDTDNDGNPGTNAVLLASFTDTIQFNDQATFSEYSLPLPVDLNGPGDVLIGIVNRSSAEGFGDFPAGIDQTASQGRSWVGSYIAGDVPASPTLPADEQWGTIDSFSVDLAGNWMVRGAGTPTPVDLINFSVD